MANDNNPDGIMSDNNYYYYDGHFKLNRNIEYKYIEPADSGMLAKVRLCEVDARGSGTEEKRFCAIV